VEGELGGLNVGAGTFLVCIGDSLGVGFSDVEATIAPLTGVESQDAWASSAGEFVGVAGIDSFGNSPSACINPVSSSFPDVPACMGITVDDVLEDDEEATEKILVSGFFPTGDVTGASLEVAALGIFELVFSLPLRFLFSRSFSLSFSTLPPPKTTPKPTPTPELVRAPAPPSGLKLPNGLVLLPSDPLDPRSLSHEEEGVVRRLDLPLRSS